MRQHLRLATEWVPWVMRCKAHSPLMLNIYYEKMFDQDLAEMRTRLGIPPLPYGVPPQ
jgi:ubiquinone biosynthesis protein Coq4